jgi:hypothetical protein
MKKILLLIIAIALSGCSSDDSETVNIPEQFDIKIEIIGANGVIPKSIISVNSSVVKEWNSHNLPFIGEYIYNTTGNEIQNSGCSCIRISSWAYISAIHELQVFNLYINGELVDSKTTIPPNNSDGTVAPTKVEFIYNP